MAAIIILTAKSPIFILIIGKIIIMLAETIIILEITRLNASVFTFSLISILGFANFVITIIN